MHREWCGVPAETAAAVVGAAPRGGVVCVGTTSVRTIESFTRAEYEAVAERGAALSRDTELLITPGFAFAHTRGIMTNFHLPRSTLMAMIGAFIEHAGGLGAGEGVPALRRLYGEAIERGYRFYSFGDAMLLLP